ncbi:MFS transporter [Streptomonospora alba]|uniref:MFS transporter n=1 Tax=Streptomonospora alba TaxID=183763 RepID=UPI0014707D36
MQGLGSGTVVSAGAAVLADATSGQQRVRVFGLLAASFGAGAAFGPLVAGALSHLGGWRSVFVVIAVGSLTALPPPGGLGSHAPHRPRASTYRAWLVRRRAARLVPRLRSSRIGRLGRPVGTLGFRRDNRPADRVGPAAGRKP